MKRDEEGNRKGGEDVMQEVERKKEQSKDERCRISKKEKKEEEAQREISVSES